VRNEDEGKGEKGEKGEYRLQRPTGQGTALLNTSEREKGRERWRERTRIYGHGVCHLFWGNCVGDRQALSVCMTAWWCFQPFFFAPKSSGVVYPHDPMGIRKDL
jgi:hypothetical protein